MSTLTVKTESADPNAMFLREVWAHGETSDGTPFELAHSGATFILSLGDFDGNDASKRIVETLSIENLVTPWLSAILGTNVKRNRDPNPEED